MLSYGYVTLLSMQQERIYIIVHINQITGIQAFSYIQRLYLLLVVLPASAR